MHDESRAGWVELPPGVKYTPLPAVHYHHYYLGGCRCSGKKAIEAEGDEAGAERVEEEPGGAGAARVGGAYVTALVDVRLQRVVDPLAHADEEHARSHQGRGCRGELCEQAGTRQAEHEQAGRHEHLVPVVKREFRRWIVHLRRVFGRA